MFLLSPANCAGKRADLLYNDAAQFPLARRLRKGGAGLAEVFSFISGLYFRRKLTYAERFATPPPDVCGVQVITTNHGLLPADTPVGIAELRAFGEVDIRSDDPRYRLPLERDAAGLARHPELDVVLLGSIATGKYVDVLGPALSGRLLFPVEFVGRGDMSRGALLLRAARAGTELAYGPVEGTLKRGTRPSRLGVAE
ncbi:MAG: hypothetical protein ACR2HK_01855 [Gemmatimonadales bacterium]